MERQGGPGELESLRTEVAELRRRVKEQEEAKELVDLLMASIVEHLPDMVFVKDAQTRRFVLFNRAGEELLGWRRSELIGKSDRDFFPPSEAEFFEAKDTAVLTSGRLLDIPEEPIHTRNGDRLLHTKKVPIVGPDGRPRYLLGISEDITEWSRAAKLREELVRKLEKAVREREDLLAIVSHDLRNPLGAILSNAELLLPPPEGSAVNPPPTERVEASATRIWKAAGHMKVLIERLVDAAAIEAGRLSLVPKSESPEQLVAEALELMEPVASPKRLHLSRAVEADIPEVRCDRQRIAQVFTNLIGNAIRHAPGETTIEVLARREGPDVRFEVRDAGPGVAPEALPHLFDRYWQAGRAVRGSAGLGLYIVKGTVEAHGGRVGVENRAGGGCSFSFTLPVAGLARAVLTPSAPGVGG